MSHVLHADVHEVGLRDGCPACSELAQHPLRDLDRDMLRDLLERAVDTSKPTRSEAEAVAVRKVEHALQRSGQIAEVAPDLLELYLLERWHLPTKIRGGHDNHNGKDGDGAN